MKLVKQPDLAIVKPMKLTIKSVVQNLKNPTSKIQTSLLVTLASLTYLYRAHPYFLKPQLYAEDGVLWLSEGGFKGLSGIIQPYHGFFHTAERLFGYVVSKLPLQWAPMLFALAAWALFILTAYYLLSRRTKLLSSNFERIFMTLALCLIANFKEFFFNFSNSIFLMGIIGVIILVAEKSKYKEVTIAERAFFLVTCLTLNFAWLYVPLVLLNRFKFKIKDNYFLIVSIVTAVIQGICYIVGNTDRSPITLFSLFSKFTLLELYNQLIIPALRFARIDIGVTEYSTQHYPVYFVTVTVIAVVLASIIVFKKTNRQVRYLLFFLAAMTFATVKSPTLTVSSPVEALKIMATVDGGNRYFVYGVLGVNIVFIKIMYEVLKAKARYPFIILFMTFGMLSSIHYKSFFPDKQWNDYTDIYRQQIELINTGKEKSVLIPSNPYPWTMILGTN